MTALFMYAKGQLRTTLHSPRRLNVLFLVMLALAATGVVLASTMAPQSIQYPQRFLTATPAVLCAGETFTYPVNIDINESDAVSRITEGWCRATDGICPRQFQEDEHYVNFLNGYSVSATATRAVPPDLPPGDWQFRHCNETHSSGLIDVVCYQVAVTVKDCQVKP